MTHPDPDRRPPDPMNRTDLVDAIAQTSRELAQLHADIGDGDPTDDQAGWWSGLLAEFEDYTARLRALDAARADRLARLVPPPR